MTIINKIFVEDHDQEKTTELKDDPKYDRKEIKDLYSFLCLLIGELLHDYTQAVTDLVHSRYCNEPTSYNSRAYGGVQDRSWRFPVNEAIFDVLWIQCQIEGQRDLHQGSQNGQNVESPQKSKSHFLRTHHFKCHEQSQHYVKDKDCDS